MIRRKLLILLAALLACAGCAGDTPADDPLLVFAAASLGDVMEEIGAAWEAQHPGEPVGFSFAGSNALARQIAAGAPADLFVAADRQRLEEAGDRVDPEGAVALLGNGLAVVVPAADRMGDDVPLLRSARDLLELDRIGLADPEAVPAGVYAREWLERAGVWDELRDRVVPALDVRANLAAVASGSVPVGIVYATDAASGVMAGRVRVVLHRGADDRIVYWAAPVSERAVADRFLGFLAGSEAGAIFRRHGFRHPPTERSGG